MSMIIKKHANPYNGYDMVVQDEAGNPVATFHGEYAAQDAQLFIDTLMARDAIGRLSHSLAWSMGRSADRYVLSFWIRGKKFEATEDNAVNALDAITRLVSKTDNLIEQAKGAGVLA